MPMRRDLGSINAPEAHHEWRTLGAWVAGHRRKIASLYDRRPLQVAEAHDLGCRGAVFFLLAVNRRRERGHSDQRDTNTSHSNLFHPTLLCQKDRGPELAKKILFPSTVGNSSQSRSRASSTLLAETAMIQWKHSANVTHENPK